MKHNWEYKKLGTFLHTSSGGTPLKSVKGYYEGGNIPWLRSGEVCQKDIYKPEIYITSKALNESNAKLVPENSLVIAMYGATAGQVGIIRRTMTTNQAVCSIFPSQYYLQDFLYYYFSFKKDKIVDKAYGAAQPNISQTIIKNLYIPVPPIKTQERIVKELDEINGMIEGRKEQIKLLDQLAQSIFYEMFGDPITNPKGWEVKPLKNIAEIISGGTPSTSDESNWNGDVNWITPAEMTNGLYYGKTQRKITEKAALKLTLMPIGTVLFSSRAPIGKLGITTEPMCCNQGFKNFICSSELSNLFLYYTLLLSMKKINELGRGATFKEISAKSIGSYKIPVPNKELQNEFASRIEMIEEQKKDIENSIKELETLLASRMDYWFN